MKRLVTGTGRMQTSWAIRGAQLGQAIGATVDPVPRSLAGFDQMILVKRAKLDALQMAQKSRVPVVYDIVDAWQQSLGEDRTEKAAKDWLVRHLELVRPAAIVAATVAMAEDCRDAGIPILALEHHARPGIVANPVRESVTKVGYEGGERYLGRWRSIIEAECLRRNWAFVVNPPSLSDLDIVIAMRDDDGYAARHWKSNVKLANAQGSGTPCVMNRERGYLETACGAELWADTPEELTAAFDRLTSRKERVARSEKLKRAAPRLEDVARRYQGWLDAL